MIDCLPFSDFRKTVERMCADQKKGDFTPILEADVVAHLYHLFIRRLKIPASIIHLSSRVKSGKDPKKKPDIVLGKVISNDRSVIAAKTIIEVKAFSGGLTDQQCRTRFNSVIESDFPKLRSYKEQGRVLFQLLYDERDFLSRGDGRGGDQYIDKIRCQLSKPVSFRVLWARKKSGNWIVKEVKK